MIDPNKDRGKSRVISAEAGPAPLGIEERAMTCGAETSLTRCRPRFACGAPGRHSALLQTWDEDKLRTEQLP